MRLETLSLLRNPYTHEQLRLDNDTLVGVESNQTFPIQDGIPIFLSDNHLSRRNKWFRRFYDIAAFAYDDIVNLGDNLKINSEGIIRKEYIGELEVRTGEKVLETAIGTASNLFFMPTSGDYYGVDISMRMLKRAKVKLRRRKRRAELFQANGEYLPFIDNSFDLVFQMGGLQFFADPYQGISEMVRVAKRGTTIHILDEMRSISRALKRSRSKETRIIKGNSLSDIQQLVPSGMHNIRSQILLERDYFLLTFFKP